MSPHQKSEGALFWKEQTAIKTCLGLSVDKGIGGVTIVDFFDQLLYFSRMFLFALNLMVAASLVNAGCVDQLESFSTVEAFLRALKDIPKTEVQSKMAAADFVFDYSGGRKSKSVKVMYLETDIGGVKTGHVRLAFRAKTRGEASRFLEFLNVTAISATMGFFGKVTESTADVVDLSANGFSYFARSERAVVAPAELRVVESLAAHEGQYYFLIHQPASFKLVSSFLVGLSRRENVRVREPFKRQSSGRELRDVFDGYRNLDSTNFPEVQFSELRKLEALPISKVIFSGHSTAADNVYHGDGFEYLANANYRGNHVFVKFPNRILRSNQIRLYRFLSDLKLGPRFYGLTHDAQGREGIVLEFVPGVHFNPTTRRIPDSVEVSMDTYRQLENLKAALSKIGLVYGSDVQLRIRYDGKVFMIDPEFLSFERNAPRETSDIPTELSAGHRIAPLQGIDRMLGNLEAILKSRKLWAAESGLRLRSLARPL